MRIKECIEKLKLHNIAVIYSGNKRYSVSNWFYKNFSNSPYSEYKRTQQILERIFPKHEYFECKEVKMLLMLLDNPNLMELEHKLLVRILRNPKLMSLL